MISLQLKPLQIRNVTKIFLEIPLIKDILDARTIELARIINQKGAKNYFGQFLSLEEADNNPRSVLAGTVQSYELALLYPILNPLQNSVNAVVN